eukprot:6175773-Pleurochrysis_carterae.AAC.2
MRSSGSFVQGQAAPSARRLQSVARRSRCRTGFPRHAVTRTPPPAASRCARDNEVQIVCRLRPQQSAVSMQVKPLENLNE